jgi:hypothetical protein
MSEPPNPRVLPETEAAIASWMGAHGWKVRPARWEMESDLGFYVWWEDAPPGERLHALWVAESMVRGLGPEELVRVLEREGVEADLRISFKIRIQERGDGYRVSVVSRRSGEFPKPE